jgi:hypothetical protein
MLTNGTVEQRAQGQNAINCAVSDLLFLFCLVLRTSGISPYLTVFNLCISGLTP